MRLVREPNAQFGITARDEVRFKEVKVGWLRSAYVVAFAALGYRYVLRDQRQPIRDQIAAADQDLLRGFWTIEPAADRSKRQIGLVRFGSDVSSVTVQMRRHIVFLPRPGEGDVYAHLA